jgi:hypothetical protein
VLNNTRTDAIEWFFLSAGMLVISGGIFSVLMGWARAPERMYQRSTIASPEIRWAL